MSCPGHALIIPGPRSLDEFIFKPLGKEGFRGDGGWKCRRVAWRWNDVESSCFQTFCRSNMFTPFPFDFLSLRMRMWTESSTARLQDDYKMTIKMTISLKIGRPWKTLEVSCRPKLGATGAATAGGGFFENWTRYTLRPRSPDVTRCHQMSPDVTRCRQMSLFDAWAESDSIRILCRISCGPSRCQCVTV